ncbi:MAG TPA: type II secretion system protein GspK [Polyangiaceae bacterium]|nr:type II secretion system protein GspK [Polyangiaceae bacterium]
MTRRTASSPVAGESASRPLASPAASPAASVLAREQWARLRALRRRKQRGVALIMVLGTLTLLSVMLTEFQDSTSAELGSSVTARDQLKAEYAAVSALSLSRLLIAAEPTIRVQVAPLFMLAMKTAPPQIPVWEFSDAILGAFSDAEGGMAFANLSGTTLTDGRNLGLENAGFRIQVVDEDSKINLNLAARADTFSQQRMAEQLLALIGGPQYNEMFQALDAEGNAADRQTICGALIDWTDPNLDLNPCTPRATTATQSGSEDSYYQMLPKPYQRKNAGFDSLDEMRLVRGMDDEFWNTFVQPDPDNPASRVVTVWGTGLVNVNTANPQTLLTLACHEATPNSQLCIDPLMQAKFLSTLKMAAMFTPGIPLFPNAKAFMSALQGKGMVGTMMAAMGIPPVTLLSAANVEKVVAVESKVFSIYTTGYVRHGTRETSTRIHAVIDLRGAPPPGTSDLLRAQGQLQQALGTAGTTTPPATSGSAGTSGLPAGFAEGGIASALLPKAGGSFLYYRVD